MLIQISDNPTDLFSGASFDDLLQWQNWLQTRMVPGTSIKLSRLDLAVRVTDPDGDPEGGLDTYSALLTAWLKERLEMV